MYFIEFLARKPEERAIYIRGWAFDDTERAPVEIDVTAQQRIEEVLYKSKYREDVLDYYGLDYSKEYGFILKIVLEDLKGLVDISFIDGLEPGKDEVLTLDLNKKQCYPKEFNMTKEVLRRVKKKYTSLFKSGNGIRYLMNAAKKQLPGTDPVYQRWMDKNEHGLYEGKIQEILRGLDYRPLISILVPVYNVDLTLLRKMVESVEKQTYPDWELCIADDCSTNPQIRQYLERLSKENSKIKVAFRSENGNISKATNTAYEMATGELIALLDDDDELASNALLETVIYFNEHPDTEMLYSDEDKIDLSGTRNDPYFKPDYSPDSLLSNNYICHFLVFRRSLIEPGETLMRSEFDGAQDHDLIMRLVERTDKIGHIPKILYHWRMTDTSTAQSAANKDYIVERGVAAIEDTLRRRGLSGSVTPTAYGGFYDVQYDVTGDKKVSVIIPTKNNAGDIRTCVHSIVEKTHYPNYEIVIVNNGSDDPEALQAFKDLSAQYPDIVRIYNLPIPFNYSRINNKAAEFADGDFYLFLNDDTEVITVDWMSKMLGYAQQPWVGCVGAKLYYPDDTIQHAGVVMGILGIAGHVFNRYPKDIPGYFGRLILNVNYTAVTAACLMIERDKFWQVGGFDENIAVSFNDVDLCCKVFDAGYYNVYMGTVELYHFESKSRGYETTADKMLRFDKERGRIVRKWRPYIARDPMYNPNLTLIRGDYGIDA